MWNLTLWANFIASYKLQGKSAYNMNKNNTICLFPFFLVLYEFTVYLANDMIMPGMIQVVRDFSVSNAYVALSFTAFIGGGASLQIILGPISDRFGRRKIMLIGALFFLLCTIFIALSHSIEQFIVARFFQGMGLCFIFVVGYAAIQEMYDEKKAVKLISLMAIVALVAPLVGPLLGGIYVEFFHWRGIFVLIGLLGFISFIGLNFYMPETVHLKLSPTHIPAKKTDLSKLPRLSFSGSINNYLALLKNKAFIVGSIAFGFSGIPLLAWIAVSPVILIHQAHLSFTWYGICQLPVFGALILGNILLQHIVKKKSLEKIIYLGSFFVIIGLFSCGILPFLFGESYLNILFPFSIYCFGLAICSASFTRLILFSSPIAKGSVSALMSLISTGMYTAGSCSMVLVYREQKNIHFGLFCLLIGAFFIPFTQLFLKRISRLRS